MNPLSPSDLARLQATVPELGVDLAALHLIRFGDPEQAIVFGHLVAGRLEAVHENMRALVGMVASLDISTKQN